jgi:hypothetical protein
LTLVKADNVGRRVELSPRSEETTHAKKRPTSVLQTSILSKMIMAGALLTAGAMSAPAGAMPASDAGLRAARDAISPIEQAACWRFGSHDWGWYPFCGPPPPPPPYAAWDYVPPPNCRDVAVRENHWGQAEVHHYQQCY